MPFRVIQFSFIIYIYIYIISRCRLKDKLIPGSIQANRLIAELPEKRKKIATSIQFRNDLLKSQKRVHYQMNLIDFKGLNDYLH